MPNLPSTGSVTVYANPKDASVAYFVQTSGLYEITAVGASGGGAPAGGGGLGSINSGDIFLTAGEEIDVFVGQQGYFSSTYDTGGGGGASAVIEYSNGGEPTPLIFAGGGGGASGSSLPGGNAPDNIEDSGFGGLGGTSSDGGGGGGFNDSGVSKQGTGGGGASFVGGGYGGDGSSTVADGGFGAGGGADVRGGGGGGGFSGGDGGSEAKGGTVATAGTSYVISGTTNASLSQATAPGNGEVIIELLCYLHGTRILTPTGLQNIEDLHVGDAVVTRFNGVKPILWIGRQSHNIRTRSKNRDNNPIHFHRGSLGGNLPANDLFVSPGHSMLVGEVLVLARALVNGVTITQDWAPEFVSYYQIELDAHDCILAEGTWSETFADGPGLRGRFQNAADFYETFPDHCPPEELVPLCAKRVLSGRSLENVLGPIVAAVQTGRVPGDLRGLVDAVVGDWRLEGWAQDINDPQLPIQLEIRSGNVTLGTVLSCHFREDLKKAEIGNGQASFSFKSPVKLTQPVLAGLTVCRLSDKASLPLNPNILHNANVVNFG